MNIVTDWVASLPMSIKLLLSDPVSVHTRGTISQRSYCHLEVLGPLPRSTVGNSRTVDWNRGGIDVFWEAVSSLLNLYISASGLTWLSTPGDYDKADFFPYRPQA